MNKFVYGLAQQNNLCVDQLSNKHSLSIIFFIIKSKNLLIVLILRNKHFFLCYYDQFGNPPLLMIRTKLSKM